MSSDRDVRDNIPLCVTPSTNDHRPRETPICDKKRTSSEVLLALGGESYTLGSDSVPFGWPWGRKGGLRESTEARRA